jgi:hypothetical protein
LIYNQIFKLPFALLSLDRTMILKSGFVKVLRASRKSESIRRAGGKKSKVLVSDLGKQSGGNRQKRQSDSAGKPSVKLARRRECRCRRQQAIEVGYRGAFSRRGFG